MSTNQTSADNSKLTATMLKALAFARQNGGHLYRHPGGYWGAVNFSRGDTHFSTPTIEGLVQRGVGVYTSWKEGRNGRFPVQVTLII